MDSQLKPRVSYNISKHCLLQVLLFSFMTKLLDILEDFCYLRKYKFSRIDGSMDFETRQAQVRPLRNFV